MKRKKAGFTLVELICVLVILALLALIVGRVAVKNIKEAKTEITDSQKKAILNAAEKWSVDNSGRFDDIDSQKIVVGLDVVFLIDVSGSMRASMASGESRVQGTVEAVNAALSVLRDGEGGELNRIGFVLFSGLASDGTLGGGQPLRSASKSLIYQTNGLLPSSEVEDLSWSGSGSNYTITVQGKNKAINGGTYTQLGIQAASKMLYQSAENNRIPVLILLTDGEPSSGVGANVVDVSNPSKLFNLQDGDTGSGHWTWCLSSKTFNANYRTTCEKVGYPYTQATDRSVVMVWNVMRVASELKKQVSSAYNGSKMYFYTIGLGLTSDFGKFMLDPSEERLASLSSSKQKLLSEKNLDVIWHLDISANLYDYIINNEERRKYDYNYVTQAFLNSASLDDLKQNFYDIAMEVTNAAKVSEVCVTIDELYDGGYLSKKDIKLSSGDAISNYVLMSYNEPTNQYSYAFAETDEQKKTCKNYIESYQEANS